MVHRHPDGVVVGVDPGSAEGDKTAYWCSTCGGMGKWTGSLDGYDDAECDTCGGSGKVASSSSNAGVPSGCIASAEPATKE